jgi:hypothetical protein
MSVREATAQDLNAILNLYSELQPEDQRLDDAAAAALFDTILATPPPPPSHGLRGRGKRRSCCNLLPERHR